VTRDRSLVVVTHKHGALGGVVRRLARLRCQAAGHGLRDGYHTYIVLEVVACRIDTSSPVDRTQMLQVHRIDILAYMDHRWRLVCSSQGLILLYLMGLNVIGILL